MVSALVPSVLDIFRSRRIAVLVGLGFASGLPLLLVGQTLAARMTAAGVKLETIGLFSAVGLPYTFKPLWAPLLDRFELPWLGRRRGWILFFQCALIVFIGILGTIDAAHAPGRLAVLATIVAFLSASHDIVIDAYTTDVLEPHERAAGSAASTLGYRIAILVTGTLALVLADFVPWRTIYFTLAALMSIGLFATFLAPEPPRSDHPPRSFGAAVLMPFRELFGLKRAGVLLAFVALYKFGDYLAQPLSMPFLKSAMGFSFTAIATINKAFGFAGTLAGSFLASLLIARHGLRRMLLFFGVMQASTNLLYAALAQIGKSYPVLGAAVLLDNVANAMGTTAFVAFLMSLCSRASSATQYALLTSLSSVGLRVFGGTTGFLQSRLGWSGFYALTALIALPGLLLVRLLPPEQEQAHPS